jgi:hypothetical protein
MSRQSWTEEIEIEDTMQLEKGRGVLESPNSKHAYQTTLE